MVTIKDVARECGVAISTVSNVLNHVDVVSDETKKKVMDAVKKLNYVPNMNARLLKVNKKNTIGLFVENVQGGFYNVLIQSIHMECKRRGYLLNIYVCNNSTSKEVFSRIASAGVAAAIIINTLQEEFYVNQLLEMNLPLVFLDRSVSGTNLSSRLIGNYEGVTCGMEYLIERGNRRIGYIHGIDNYDNSTRYQAFLDTMKRHGLTPYEPFVLHGSFEQDVTYEEVKKLLESGVAIPDAIFCANDAISFGCIKALREYGIRVPRDISIMGFDDEITSQYYIPALTTVHSPIEELGVSSAKEAIRLANGNDNGKKVEGTQKMLSTRLVERESVL